MGAPHTPSRLLGLFKAIAAMLVSSIIEAMESQI